MHIYTYLHIYNSSLIIITETMSKGKCYSIHICIYICKVYRLYKYECKKIFPFLLFLL